MCLLTAASQLDMGHLAGGQIVGRQKCAVHAARKGLINQVYDAAKIL